MSESEQRESEAWQFLGGEFLLWLWYQTEENGGEFELAERGRVGVAFDRHLELAGVSTGGEDLESVGPGKVTVRGDLPTRSPEAAAALRSGRIPSVARLTLATPEESFEVTLDAARFDLKSVKVVASEDSALPEDAGDRLRLLLLVPAILDDLYARFLAERLSPKFRVELLPAWKRWIQQRSRPLAAAAGA